MKHFMRLYTSDFVYSFILCIVFFFAAAFCPKTAWSTEHILDAAAAPIFPAVIKTVQVNVANVRIKPSVKSAILARLKKGDRVVIINRQDSWLAVKLPDNRLGWAHHNLFSKPQVPFIDTAAGKLINEIQSKIISNKKEKVIFKLNGDYPPETFVIDIEQPKIVCDFKGLLMSSGIKRTIKANGALIEQIRVAYHEKPISKVRVVVDLSPKRKYKIAQTFYRHEHIFELAIQPEQ